MDDRTFRIIALGAILGGLSALKPWIMPWLRKHGFTGSGLGRDKPKPEESGDEKSP